MDEECEWFEFLVRYAAVLLSNLGNAASLFFQRPCETQRTAHNKLKMAGARTAHAVTVVTGGMCGKLRLVEINDAFVSMPEKTVTNATRQTNFFLSKINDQFDIKSISWA